MIGIMEDPFQWKLAQQGRAEIPVGSQIRPSEYTFFAVQSPGESGWVTISGSIQAQ
jgi:hypothetical protein